MPTEKTSASQTDLPLACDLTALSQLQGWTKEVYADFAALQTQEMSYDEFRAKYSTQCAILNLDITGFTETCMKEGQINSLLRIFDTQKVAVPVLERHGATLIRAFADDIVALFKDPNSALDAALEIHQRMAQFNKISPRPRPPQCCIGIGYGKVYAIGPNFAQGDEMNRASKLGEDIARGGETLVTEQAAEVLSQRDDIRLVAQKTDDMLFAFYRVNRV